MKTKPEYQCVLNQNDFHVNLILYPYFPTVCGRTGLKETHWDRAGCIVVPYYPTFVFQPPFVMEKWIVGIVKNLTVECTVTYEVSSWGGRLVAPPSGSKLGFIQSLRVHLAYWKTRDLTSTNMEIN